jgi:hypothetical protein
MYLEDPRVLRAAAMFGKNTDTVVKGMLILTEHAAIGLQ